uniref:Uncharacterized protein n=1 Tax=Arundo donax TaxID=35708 RepID=A0A0A9ARH2_ARUDO
MCLKLIKFVDRCLVYMP